MLVDLARNDVNRVCDPLTVHVSKFLIVQKFSHVQHLVILNFPLSTSSSNSSPVGIGSPVSCGLDKHVSMPFGVFFLLVRSREYVPTSCSVNMYLTSLQAPKVRAMELIAELEKEKRGVYAGAVGYFGYGKVSFDEDADGGKGKVVEEEGAMDT